MKNKFFSPLYPKQNDKEQVMISASEMHDPKDKKTALEKEMIWMDL